MKIEQGQVAVVTGGASGIGFGLAEALVDRGVAVALSDIRAEAVAEAAARLTGRGGRVLPVVTDVTDPASVDELADRTLTEFGQVDLVCNNAGVVCAAAPMWEQTLETWQRMIDIKVLGVVHGVRSFAPHLVRRGHGHILNTASSGGLAPLPDRTPYTATMHAIMGLTETLDIELRAAASGVGATVLCPGLVDTPLGQNSATLGMLAPPRRVDPEAMKKYAAAEGGIISSRDVAEASLVAVEADRVHVAPGAGVYQRAEARTHALLSDIAHDRK
ncbi:SDR family oxidoreductase [Streptomyces griseiscabiei]|uniref:SDR family NAD(P)-dependent oxidoreductase n=1 Tax=Streptomyces griseiscabiei TaxID=2993540 RepID=A0ABU4LHP6_9ACTN|nr:SDR family NAD(P)-dependent oxidoreductase [Streptomyces griseiscabiei]MBZ3900375.1 SDR family NAD(P)-dependent oxidoreductase [Streptomyces griseiscabiei]MDX2914543.1 SDR family NAD(P)-dependent oxidoreductase [Streptomyces griseiscabiei]